MASNMAVSQLPSTGCFTITLRARIKSGGLCVGGYRRHFGFSGQFTQNASLLLHLPVQDDSSDRASKDASNQEQLKDDEEHLVHAKFVRFLGSCLNRVHEMNVYVDLINEFILHRNIATASVKHVRWCNA